MRFHRVQKNSKSFELKRSSSQEEVSELKEFNETLIELKKPEQNNTQGVDGDPLPSIEKETTIPIKPKSEKKAAETPNDEPTEESLEEAKKSEYLAGGAFTISFILLLGNILFVPLALFGTPILLAFVISLVLLVVAITLLFLSFRNRYITKNGKGLRNFAAVILIIDTLLIAVISASLLGII